MNYEDQNLDKVLEILVKYDSALKYSIDQNTQPVLTENNIHNVL